MIVAACKAEAQMCEYTDMGVQSDQAGIQRGAES